MDHLEAFRLTGEKARLANLIGDLLASGVNHETIVLLLRDRGFTQGESMALISQWRHLPLREAKRIVMNGPAWKDRLDMNELVQGLAEQAWPRSAVTSG